MEFYREMLDFFDILVYHVDMEEDDNYENIFLEEEEDQVDRMNDYFENQSNN